MELNRPLEPTQSSSSAEHELNELEKIGSLHALAGVWRLVLQYCGPQENQTNNKAVKERREIERAVAAIVLIEDASDAFEEVVKNGLHKHRRDGLQGEAYLRLWGLLNAAFLLASAIKALYSIFRPNEYPVAAKKLESQPLYEWRMRLGSHVMDYATSKGKNFHSLVQMDMFRADGIRSFVSSDKGYQEVDVMADIWSFEQTCMTTLVELTEWKARRIITQKSDHHAWLNERLDFARGKIDPTYAAS